MAAAFSFSGPEQPLLTHSQVLTVASRMAGSGVNAHKFIVIDPAIWRDATLFFSLFSLEAKQIIS
jgi:hypothetical protein